MLVRTHSSARPYAIAAILHRYPFVVIRIAIARRHCFFVRSVVRRRTHISVGQSLIRRIRPSHGRKSSGLDVQRRLWIGGVLCGGSYVRRKGSGSVGRGRTVEVSFSFVSIERSRESWMYEGGIEVCLYFVSMGAHWGKGDLAG